MFSRSYFLYFATVPHLLETKNSHHLAHYSTMEIKSNFKIIPIETNKIYKYKNINISIKETEPSKL